MRNVLITGGAKGIGRIMRHALEADGWVVASCGRTPAAEVNTHLYLQCDLREPGSVEKLIHAVGCPKVLICNAGDYGALGRFDATGFAQWSESFDLNFFAVARLVHGYLTALHQLPKSTLLDRRKIVIVGGAGVGGSTVRPHMSAYSVAKAALVRFVEVIAVEHPEVDINVLAPGAFDTGITEQARKAGLEPPPASPQASANLAATLRSLLRPACDGVSGRLISARWDWSRIRQGTTLLESPDLLTLRRIDDDKFFKPFAPVYYTVRVNDRIENAYVRVIDADGSLLGVMATHEALKRAKEQGLDLVEVNPKADPPVCRIEKHGGDR
jgi:NAD(P)-dependent dehydrogenase (short-subunit alcohol dehydrogenase family)